MFLIDAHKDGVLLLAMDQDIGFIFLNYAEEKEKYDQSAVEWEKSNCVSLLMIKHTISSEIKNAIPDSVYAKEYFASIEEYFKDVLPI